MSPERALDSPETDVRIASSGKPATGDESEIIFQVMAGELAGHLGEIDEAVEHYIAASGITNDPKIAERATRIALYANDNSSALKAAKRWVELVPDNLESRQTLAILYLRNNDPEQAITHFDYVIKSAPEDSSNSFLLVGATLAREKNQDLALDTMNQLVKRHPNNAKAYFALSNLALGAKRHSLAAQASQKALAINPQMVEAQGVRARAFMALGETERALQAMQAAVITMPENYELRVTYGRMLVQAKQYDRARKEFKLLLKQKPGDPDLLYTLGLLNLQDKHYDEAVDNFKQLLKSDQHVAEGHYYLGRVAEERGSYEKAKAWYLKVGEGDYYADAQVRAANMFVKLGSLQKARAHLRQVRGQADDEDSAVRFYLAEGQLLREAGLYHAGMEMYNRALTEHSGNEDLLYARALMAEKIDRVDLLEADLRTILEQDPDNATALNALGYTLADRNERIQEAFGYIKRALEVRPDDPTVIDSMGWVHFRMGNLPEAEKYLRRAFELLKDAEIAGHLSELFWAKGDKTQARDLLQRALEKDPEHEYLLELRQRFLQ